MSPIRAFQNSPRLAILSAVLAVGSYFAAAALVQAQSSLIACENNKTHAVSFPPVGKTCTSAQTTITLGGTVGTQALNVQFPTCDAPSDGCCACPTGTQVTGGGGDCNGESEMVSSGPSGDQWCIRCASIFLVCPNGVCGGLGATATVPIDVIVNCANLKTGGGK